MDLNEAAASLPGRQSKNVVVALGRFNPPTRGHYKMIGAMKKFIDDNPELNLEAIPVVVIVAGSKSDDDKVRNPLTGDQRKTFMESSGQANGVKFLIAPNAFAAFAAVREAGMEPIAVAAGSDRIDDYMRILNGSFTEDGTPVSKGGKAIKHHAVPGLKRDPDAEDNSGDDFYKKVVEMIQDRDTVDDNMISGSLARYAVKNGAKDAFAYIVKMNDPKKRKLADKMFDIIEKALA